MEHILGKYKRKMPRQVEKRAVFEEKSLTTLQELEKKVKAGVLTEEQAIECYAVRSLEDFKEYCIDKLLLKIF